MARSPSRAALGLGLLFWLAVLFAPLAFVQPTQAADAENYGTVIGIVSFAQRPIWPQTATS